MGRKQRSDQPFLPGLDLIPAPRAAPARKTVEGKVPAETQCAAPEAGARNETPEREPTVVVAAAIRHADRPSGERRAIGMLATRLAEIAADLHLADQLSAERPAPPEPREPEQDSQ